MFICTHSQAGPKADYRESEIIFEGFRAFKGVYIF